MSPAFKNLLKFGGTRSQPVPAKPEDSVFRVLIVDDEELDRDLTAHFVVDAWPFRRAPLVDFAQNGKEAMSKLKINRYALVMLDWNMPQMSGGDVLREMRQASINVPVVVVSGLDREDITEDLTEFGAVFLSKLHMCRQKFHTAITSSLRLLGKTDLYLDAQDQDTFLPQMEGAGNRDQVKPDPQEAGDKP